MNEKVTLVVRCLLITVFDWLKVWHLCHSWKIALRHCQKIAIVSNAHQNFLIALLNCHWKKDRYRYGLDNIKKEEMILSVWLSFCLPVDVRWLTNNWPRRCHSFHVMPASCSFISISSWFVMTLISLFCFCGFAFVCFKKSNQQVAHCPANLSGT